MSDLLSQDEIDALLNGVGDSQENVDKFLDDGNENTNDEIINYDTSDNVVLDAMQIDALGEIGNISMGSAATALYEIIGQKVDITTPKVEILTWQQLLQQYQKPFVVTKVEYTQGLVGTNLLIMKTDDVKILTNLMLGEDPKTDREISELELSAMGEAMNQMVGLSCTSISSMINKKIDIAPPKADYYDFSTESNEEYNKLYGEGKIVKVAFKMVVGDLIDSEIMQILPIGFAKLMVESMFGVQMSKDTTPEVSEPVETVQTIQETAPKAAPEAAPAIEKIPQFEQPVAQQRTTFEQPVVQNNIFEQPIQRQPISTPQHPINVQPVQFETLDESYYSNYKENIGLIMDVPLQVTVELGRTTKLIREILEFGPGSIVELDKLAGEPVDILVNGKIIAKGEVVVIDENFGVRITDIIHPSKRI